MKTTGINIGFVSTRFAGTDGVSLESNKWADVLQATGHRCYWYAGELETDRANSMLVPEAHFKFEKNKWINRQVFGSKYRQPEVTDTLHHHRSLLKNKLRQFIQLFGIELLIVENALSIPLNIPLGLAITEVISETGIPTIAHHHDFFWERSRFSENAVGEYLQMAFPPVLENIKSVVINSNAQQELAHRRGIAADIIPNVLDFETPPIVDDQKLKNYRELIGITEDDTVILQPTRIIKRKGIEMAVDLVRVLDIPHCKLVISHDADDEGSQYGKWLTEYARSCAVDLRIVNSAVRSPWATPEGDGNRLSLWDIYPLADMITLPSRNEGFGNALLEGIYFKKPILVNRYRNFIKDIEPLGFDLISIDGYVDSEAVESVKNILVNPQHLNRMTEQNYQIASKNYSYSVLEKRLNHLVEMLIPAVATEPQYENLHSASTLRLVDAAG
jgi:glycosyltransferase involved in cell wall biosynthesis